MALIVDVDMRFAQPETERRKLEAFLERACSEALKAEGWDAAEVSVVVTGDEEIRTLNREFRGIDEPTDVLSFPLEEWEGDPAEGVPVGEILLGDVVISLERARSQADEYGHSLLRELGFLAVHGVLHLLGYDHETEDDRRAMREREEAVLSALGLTV